MKKFETKYGYFSEDGNEYIIKTPRTPKPWINVISNGRYGLTISQAGGGFSWLDHSEFNRLNRWHQDLVQDNWGKYIYFKDEDSGEVWNPAWLPIRTELDKYQCIHGFGYTCFFSEYKGLRSILTIFVTMDSPLEIWDIRLEDKSGRDRNISIFTYFEWCLGSGSDNHREFHKTFIHTRMDQTHNTALAEKRIWDIAMEDRGHWNTKYPYIGFLSTSVSIADYEFDKESFIGQFGTLQSPAAVFNAKMQRRSGNFYDAVAGTKINLEIKANQTLRFHYLLGLAQDIAELDAMRAKYGDTVSVDDALGKVREYWQKVLSTTEVETPDESLNLLINKWLKYQAIAGRLWARTAYYQQSGAYGFRDQLQDSLIFLSVNPKLTEQQIRLHAEHQFRDGHVLHWWHPITETGMDSNFSDDFLWLPFVTLNYLEESDRLEFLKEKVWYYDDSKGATILEHCIRAVDFALGRMSKRGLPLIGSGDWNDGLSATGIEMKGESFWIIHFLNYILTRFADVLERMSNDLKAKQYRDEAARLREKLLEFGWDGDWFIRATKDNGEIIGSHVNKEGQIFLNTQTWSVIADSAPSEYQQKAMKAVENRLMKDNGPLLLYPAYSAPDKYIGYLSRYAAGARENGGVYTHAAIWTIWAFAKIGWDKQAFQTFKGINPIRNGMDPDRYKGEPYVTPGNIDGPDSPNYGRGSWTWYTGSAAWLQKCTLEWILGIRPVREGLLIDPHIPADWKSYTVKRLFRNTTYEILVENKSGKAGEIKRLIVDGKEISGNIIPPVDREICRVEVTL
jgi:cellobiose phosphorylase